MQHFDKLLASDIVSIGRISDGNGWRLLQPFNVGPEGAFRDVVVMLEGVERGKPFDFPTPQIEAANCQFTPYVTVVRDEAQSKASASGLGNSCSSNGCAAP
ncbi:MAG TPA: hypothetical protein VLB84_01835, partial [Bacteroidia bacterium]|nr:hypothetical protein [Bacteroidia bacterium]